eukprot:764148-Hanusia_phi.AAC.10
MALQQKEQTSRRCKLVDVLPARMEPSSKGVAARRFAMSSRLFTGLLVLSFHAVQGGLEGRIGAFPPASCVGLRDCSRPLCLRGGGADAKEAAEEDEYWSDNAEDLGNTDPKAGTDCLLPLLTEEIGQRGLGAIPRRAETG